MYSNRRFTDQSAAGLDAMARRLLVLSANLISLASLLFFGAVSICLRFLVLRKRLVVSHFHDDIGNLFSEFPGDHLDRHFLILNSVVQHMSTGWRATQNKTASSYVVAIAI